MKNQIVYLVLFSCLNISLMANSSFAHGVTQAKALELVLHRVERLVALCNLSDASLPLNIPGSDDFDPTKCKNDPSLPKKGIEPEFQNSLSSATIEELDHQNDDEPSFKGTVFLYPGLDGTRKSVSILLDEEGRPLCPLDSSGVARCAQVTNGSKSANAPVWTESDSTTLSENALHFLINSGSTSDDGEAPCIITNPLEKAKLVPFQDNMKDFSLEQMSRPDGTVFGKVTILSTVTEDALVVNMNADGKCGSYSVGSK